MAAESKTFPEVLAYPAPAVRVETRQWAPRLQVGLVYTLIVLASWTPEGAWKAALMLTTTCCVVLFALCSRYSGKEMGLGIPPLRGSLLILGLGLLFAASLPIAGMLTGLRFPPMRIVPWRGAWQYAVWALMQQFALQSFFFVRIESLIGNRRAVFAAAALFSSVHLPSPVLTVATLLGGVFFCEMFRRYRTLLPLGIVHALLGLTIAASFSDHILHHMRVGIGYLAFHR
jgi:hypothetical protein